tara:strand:+ start:68 stop:1174 length:1107 start_codon:yes stop_codon:yes gene_type:complete
MKTMKTIKKMKKMKKMKTMKTMNIFKTLILTSVILTSCTKDNLDSTNYDGLYNDGYFVTNEGNFNTGNGSISFVDEYGVVENDVFASNNSFVLGDVVQSMTIINDNAYIVVNNSNKIEIASVDSMNYVGTIEVGFPRYIKQVSDDKAYITSWGTGFGSEVKVLDLNTNTIVNTIICGVGPEAIEVSNGYAYVCNIGGYSVNNTISIIDVSSDMVITTLELSDKPNSVVVDVDENIWVLTKGTTEYDENWNTVAVSPGSLYKINNNVVVQEFTFPLGDYASNLVINNSGNVLYYSCAGAVFSLEVNSSELNIDPIINKSFYGLGFNDNYIYGASAPSFTQSGLSYRYTTNGIVVDSVNVGIGPNGYCFN